MTDTTALSLRSYGGRHRAHSHAHHQIILAVEGALDLEVGDSVGRVGAGAGALVAAGERHGYRGVGDNRCLIVDVDAPADRLWRDAATRPFFPVDQGLHHLVRFLAHETAGGVATARHGDLLLATLTGRTGAGRDTRIDRALRFIHANYRRPIAVGDIARAAAISESSLYDRFRTATGRTPQDYVAGLRLDDAQALLAGTDCGIAEIALRTGYADQSALTRALRKRRGITPARYRKDRRRLS